MERPTKKQKELLSFIDGFVKGNGYGPSYREIMRALDYKSVSTVATHVNGLIARGWLVKKDNSARSLVVVSPDSAVTAAPAVAVVAGAPDVEQIITQKITELDGQPEPTESDIADRTLLVESLRVLGFTDTYESFKNKQNLV